MSTPELNALIEEHLGLAQVIALDYSNIRGASLDEAISEAHGAMLRAADGFDPRKGDFAPYAARAIRNALNSLYAKQLKLARLFPKSLDEPPLKSDGSSDDSSIGAFGLKLADSKQDVRKSVKRRESITVLGEILKSLSPREQIVLDQMRLGHSLSEIGEKMGVSKQAVHKISAPALSKVKAALEANGYKGIDSEGFLRSGSSVRPPQRG